MKKIIFILFYLFFILTNISIARDNENSTSNNDVIMLNQVSVTATRDKELTYKIPANVTVITEKEIKKSGAENIPEVLNKKANIHFKAFNGQSSQASLSMRAFGGDNAFGKTLVLLNGRRLNRPDMAGINWLQVPIQQVERIEVVRGSSTVLYGDSAVAGVINIITKKDYKNIKSQASIILGSNDTYIERAGIISSKEKFSFAVNAENYDTDGWKQRTASYSRGGGLNIGYNVTDTLMLNFDGSYNKNMYEMPGGLTKAEMAENRKQYQPARPASFLKAHPEDFSENKYIDLGLRLEKITDNFGDFELKFAYGNKNIELNMPSEYIPSYTSRKIDTIGFLPKYVLESNIFNLKNNLVMGVDIYNEKLDLNKYNEKERITKTDSAEVKKNSIGFYLRDEINIKKDIIAAIGFRKEKVKFTGKEFEANANQKFYGDDTFREQAFELGLTKLFGEKAKIFGKFSRVYRMPFIDEKIYYQGYKPGVKYDLKPETGKSYEMGFLFSPTKLFNTSLTLFQINMQDEIFCNPNAPFTADNANENFDKTMHKGLEFSASYAMGEIVKFNGNYIYNKGQFKSGEFDGKEIPFVPNNRLGLSTNIYLPYNLSISVSMQYTDKAYIGSDFDNSEEKLAAYTVYDFYVKYNPDKFFFNDTIKLSSYIGVKNLFNKEYSTMGFEDYSGILSYYPSQGVNFIAGITFDF